MMIRQVLRIIPQIPSKSNGIGWMNTCNRSLVQVFPWKNRQIIQHMTFSTIPSDESIRSPTTVYIGNLSKESSEESIAELFSSCGLIRQVQLVKDNEGRSRGYGSIEFEEIDSIAPALDLAGKEIEGRSLIVKLPKGPPSSQDNSMTIRVQNIPFQATKNDLKEIFSDCGELVQIKIPKDKVTKNARGVAFLTFKDQEGVNKAMNIPQVMGRPVSISISVQKQRKSTLFVGNLPQDIDEDKLHELFQHCGEIYQIRISQLPNSTRQYAHVQFIASNAVSKGLRMKGTILSGSKLFIDVANSE